MTATADYPQISDNLLIQKRYERMRSAGESHNLAEMLALQQPPMSDTDREFLEGQGGCYDQFKGMGAVGDYYRKVAEEAGVSTTGKVYKSSLAGRPGDPRAWIGSKADVVRVCEERGLSCEGAVTVKPRNDVKPMPKVDIADDIVDEEVASIVEAYPEEAHNKNLRDEVREMIAPPAEYKE